jgi:hypothetical protein
MPPSPRVEKSIPDNPLISVTFGAPVRVSFERSWFEAVIGAEAPALDNSGAR